MSGLHPDCPTPTLIQLHQGSHLLEVHFDNHTECMLSCEFLRVYSPSAEVRGHGEGQEVLQIGKRLVSITGIEPVGNYAIKPIFTDEHSTGIFTWEYLYWLGTYQSALWKDYLARLQAAGYAGEAGRDAVPAPKPGPKCGS